MARAKSSVTAGTSAASTVSAISARAGPAPLAVEAAVKQLHADLKAPLAGPAAQQIERVREIAGAGERSRDRRQARRGRAAAGKSALSTASSRPGRRARLSARSGASAMMSATRRNRPGLAWNSENSCTPAGNRTRNWSKRWSAMSGRGGAAKNAQQLGDKLGQDFARPLAAGRAHAAVVPVAHHAGDRARIGEAHPRQRFQRARVVVGAGEDEVARSGEARRLLEQLGIVFLDRGEVRDAARRRTSPTSS